MPKPSLLFRNAEFGMQNGDKKSSDLSVRTKMFALRIISLFKALPSTVEAQVIGKQVLRSGTSVGAQYREGMRVRSRAEFYLFTNLGFSS
jgi:four helix bundle protein